MNRESPDRIHRLRWAILGVMCLSLVLVVMGNSILNVAIPTLARDLDASLSDLQWIVDSYALVFGGLLLTMGAVGDRFGRRGALQVGLAIVGGGAVFSAFSDSVDTLTVGRAIMGFGAALVMPATLSIITHVFPREERGKALGIWAAFAGIGGAIGPIVGGLLLEDFSWQSIFWVNIPIIVLAMGLGLWLVPTSRDPGQTRLDPVGALLSIVALGTLLFAVIEGPVKGWASWEVLASFGVSVLAWAGFILWELRTPAPMLPMRFFRSRDFTMGNIAIGFSFFVMFAFFFVMVQFLQFVQGFSPLQAAVRTLPLAGGLILAAPQSDRLVRRIGTPWTVTMGLFIVGLALLALSFIDVAVPYWYLGLSFLLLGLGMGFAMAPSTTLVMDSIPPHKAGVGSAMNDTSREIGGALGIAILGSVLTERFDSEVTAAGFPEAVVQMAQAPGPVGGAVRDAFTAALADAYLVSAIVAFVAVLLVRWKMPRRMDLAMPTATDEPTPSSDVSRRVDALYDDYLMRNGLPVDARPYDD